ncbi:MAG: sialate O-acetylesterase [Candidatus Kapabacteria bacterium]|nr:sialate O-acetylesterase [Candidatus Kapabacteria bacterium]
MGHLLRRTPHLCFFFAFGMALAAQTMPSGLRLWLRADTLTTISNGSVSKWGSLVGGHVAEAQPGAGLTIDTIGRRAAIQFVNSAFYKAPSIFPVQRDYTMYIVFKWNGVHAANNMVSGDNRAFFTSAPGVPTVLHSGDFARLGVSSQAVSGPTVIRLKHQDSSGKTSIALNNVKTSDDVLPRNIDSVIYIGAYQKGNGLNGSIAEVLIFERQLTASEQLRVETYLHDRYTIARAADPPNPAIAFLEAPRSLEVVDPEKGLAIRGVVISDSLNDVAIDVLRNGKAIGSRTFPNPKRGDTIALFVPVQQELDAYTVSVTCRKVGKAQTDTMLKSTDIAAGTVFTVTGQSNSIFGDGSLPISSWARTYGGNFSQSSGDTNYSRSTATGNGGGNNVGAWALGLQNAMADQMRMPSLCISGGVGGTRIEQHLPDVNNRMNLATIYGSWLYRIIKSGSRERIRWLFWYQGESNNANDDYLSLFDKLRSAWKLDLPNLTYIVVVQIRPGCAGPGHAKLRDEMRQLESIYPDVIVHAASGLPGHDGCHYNGHGYATLGRQLFDIFRRNELGMQPGVYRAAPTLEKVTSKGSDIEVHFHRGEDLIMTSDIMSGTSQRRVSDAWFANDKSTLHPTSVTVDGNIVRLTFAEPVTSVSYVPDYAYDDGTTIFQGPWLTTKDGVGAITFHKAPVIPVSVHDDIAKGADETMSEITDLTGRRVGWGREDLYALPTGPYIVRFASYSRCIMLVR